MRVGIEIDLISAMGSKFFVVCGTEIYLVLVRGSTLTCFRAGVKLTSFLCAGRKLLSLNFWIEVDLVITRGDRKICFFLV